MMKHYCLKCGNELADSQLICPKCENCTFLDYLENSGKTISGVLTAQQIEQNTQWTKYKCGKNGSAGHGFAAEDANAIDEILWGNFVELCGRDNSKNGPDRICNGKKIQTKYYAAAKGSVNSAFDKETNMYSYQDQVLEVPSDQYEEAIKIMREKILAGLVEGVTDPNDASKIVKKGSVTYRQAKNIAKAGNIDSLIFDAKTQSVVVLSAFGISFAINLGLMVLFRCKSKEDIKEAAQIAFLSGLQNGTITMLSGILSSQVLRTQFGRNMVAAIQWNAKGSIDYIYKTKIGRKIIHKLAETIVKKNITGAAAKNTVVKLLRTNAITNIALAVVSGIPDTIRMIGRKISSVQYIKNSVVSTSSIAGGTIGSLLGTAAGGPIGGIAGGLITAAGTGWLTKKIADKIRKDDAERMYELIKVALIQLSNDYMIQSEEEFQKCIDYIVSEKAIDTNLIRGMYSIGCDDNNDFARVELAYIRLEYYFGAVIRQRKTFCLKKYQETLLENINEIGENIFNITKIGENDKLVV